MKTGASEAVEGPGARSWCGGYPSFQLARAEQRGVSSGSEVRAATSSCSAGMSWTVEGEARAGYREMRPSGEA